jgi:hypothetical protein
LWGKLLELVTYRFDGWLRFSYRLLVGVQLLELLQLEMLRVGVVGVNLDEAGVVRLNAVVVVHHLAVVLVLQAAELCCKFVFQICLGVLTARLVEDLEKRGSILDWLHWHVAHLSHHAFRRQILGKQELGGLLAVGRHVVDFHAKAQPAVASIDLL